MKNSAILSTKGLCPTSNGPARKSFALTGPRVALDPRTAAARRDLADVRLAEYVFAPRYAAALRQVVLRDIVLRDSPDADAAAVAELKAGDAFDLLDTTGGIAWGIATRQGLVGYVAADAIGPETQTEAAA